MKDELKGLTSSALDGAEDDASRLAEALGSDPGSLAEFVDQLQVHQRLRILLRPGDPVTAAVVRELRLLPDSPRFSREVVERVKRLEPPARRSSRLLPVWAAAAVFLLIIAAVVFRRVDPPSVAVAPRKALFVARTDPPGAGDVPLVARLQGLGFAVTVKSSRDVAATDAIGHDLVLISSTSLAEDVLDPAAEFQYRFRDLTVPILTWEPRILPGLGMIEGSVHGKDWASSKGPMTVTILRPDHPLAAGLSGTVRVAAGPDRCSWGRARADALKIAVVEGDETRAAIFAYDRGAAMPGGTAPARRLSLFLFDHTSTALTPEGWTLVDAAIRWCAGR